MAHETQSNSSTGSQYLQEVLGDALADALSKVSLGQIGLQLKFNHHKNYGTGKSGAPAGKICNGETPQFLQPFSIDRR